VTLIFVACVVVAQIGGGRGRPNRRTARTDAVGAG